MEMQVIKNKSTLELQQHKETLFAQLFALRFQNSLGKLETTDMINKIRKDIARIKTELNIRIKNGEKIKPLHIKKMLLPEIKKEVKKVAKVDKKDTKVKLEVTKEADKNDEKKVATEKPVKTKLSTKSVKKVATTKVKTPSKKSTVKTTVTPVKEDKK